MSMNMSHLGMHLNQCIQTAQQLMQQTEQSSAQYHRMLQQEVENSQTLEQLAQRERQAAMMIQQVLQGHQTAMQQLQQVVEMCNQVDREIQGSYVPNMSMRTNEQGYMNQFGQQQS